MKSPTYRAVVLTFVLSDSTDSSRSVRDASSRRRSDSNDSEAPETLYEHSRAVSPSLANDNLYKFYRITQLHRARHDEEVRMEEFSQTMNYTEAFDYLTEFYETKSSKSSSQTGMPFRSYEGSAS